MTRPRFRSAPLAPDDDVSDFDSGVDPLDRWLHEHAHQAQRHDLARAVVWHDRETGTIAAYYAVCVTAIQRHEVTRRLSAGIALVPGFLVAKLALHRSLHGQGLGEQLLLDAFETVCAAAETAAGRVVVVDPVDERAAAFYARYGFQPIRESPRMYLLTSEARAALGSR